MQSRLMSLVESVANVSVGVGLALLIQVIAFPLFGVHMSISQNLVLGGLFTLVSVIRSYALRRLFEWLHVRVVGP